MVTTKVEELAAAKARVAQLEQSITAELNRELAALPARYGFDDTGAFVAAVKAAFGSKRRGRKPAAAPRRRKRAKITDETRASVKTMVEAGKTGNEIAKALGISLPSVQNIKKALGMTRKSKQ